MFDISRIRALQMSLETKSTLITVLMVFHVGFSLSFENRTLEIEDDARACDAAAPALGNGAALFEMYNAKMYSSKIRYFGSNLVR